MHINKYNPYQNFKSMLSEKYINKIPKTSRANEDSSLSPNLITKSYKEKIINLKKIADKNINFEEIQKKILSNGQNATDIQIIKI